MTDFKKQIDQLVAKARESEDGEIMKLLLLRADALEELIRDSVAEGDTDGAGFYSVLLEQVLNICEIDIIPRIRRHRLDAGDVDDES